jgi:hypothetical protein
MKIDLTIIKSIKVSPDAIYLLYCLKRNIQPEYINCVQQTHFLEENGYINEGKLTAKGNELLARIKFKSSTKVEKSKLSEDDLPFIEQYISMFPDGKMPSGALGRSSLREIKPRFETFFSKYPEYKDWELVLKATAFYLDEKEKENYAFTQNSFYFIYKQDDLKNWKSGLANYCALLLKESIESLQSTAPSIVSIPGLI